MFNTLIKELDYVREVLEEKAHETCMVIKDYTTNLVNDHQQELWKFLNDPRPSEAGVGSQTQVPGRLQQRN